MNLEVELEYQSDAVVGEGPIWDDIYQELIWIDVLSGKVFFYSPRDKGQRSIHLGQHVGAVALDERHDLVIAVRDGIAQFSRESGEIKYKSKIIQSEEIRFNDGAVDPSGRFVVGSMAYEAERNMGSLYSYTLDGHVKTLLTNVGISNGICWNLDATKMYYIDSLTQSVQIFDYDLSQGLMSNARTLIQFNSQDGTPDGMTSDVDGNLWIAMWGGAQVCVVSPEGELIDRIHFPVSNVTSLAFAGPNLSDLYVTTARYLLSPEQLAQEPLAGSLFKISTNTCGKVENCMK